MDDAANAEPLVLNGTPASGGLAAGVVVRVGEAAGPEPDTSGIDAGPAPDVLRRTRDELVVRLRRRAEDAALPEERGIFAAHAALAQDAALLQLALDEAAAGHPADAALRRAGQAMMDRLAASASERFRERAADVDDVVEQWVRLVHGHDPYGPHVELPADAVVVAQDLAPSLTAGLNRARIRAFVLGAGGPTAHTAILARGYGIPAVVRVGESLGALVDGATVVVDGTAGTVELRPSPERVAEAADAARNRGDVGIQGSGHTADGVGVVLAANAGSADQVQLAAEAGAQEIGLFRTEFLYLERGGLPSEDEQAQVYTAAVSAMEGRRVVFRTLDVGGDKPLPALDMPAEPNPMLGNRGIRLWLRNTELARTQLRALLRASAAGPVGIMFPMVSRVDELDAALDLVAAVRQELTEEGVAIGEDIAHGVMVETPAAVLCADQLAQRCDFLSLGTNDLLQYLFAADRDNAAVTENLDSSHPALLRAVAIVGEHAARTGTHVAVCGESAADPDVQLALVGLGVRELSMVVGDLAATQANLARHALPQLHEAAQRAIEQPDAAAARAVLRRLSEGAHSDGASEPAITPQLREHDDGTWAGDVVVGGAEGLHARPAAELVELASTFTADITLRVGDVEADAKSMLGVLSLGADQGQAVTVRASGVDAEQAARAVCAAIAGDA